MDYDNPDWVAPDADLNRTGINSVDAANKFRGEVGEQSAYHRQHREFLTVTRQNPDGTYTYDRPGWFRGHNFIVRNVAVAAPGMYLHSHTTGAMRGPSVPDWSGAQQFPPGVVGGVIHQGGMTFYMIDQSGQQHVLPMR